MFIHKIYEDLTNNKLYTNEGRGGRVDEGARLESVYAIKVVSRVRIPSFPPAYIPERLNDTEYIVGWLYR